MVFHLPRYKRKTAVTAGIIGNVMEWYDFSLYGYMAPVISLIFFPEGNQLTSLLATYGIFTAGFVMRPLGSVLFGWLGDTMGRSRTMLISVIMMVLPTVLLGLLPTYKNIGLLAPALLVLIRMVQGLSVGGEFSSSATYLVETAPDKKRGLSGSWANFGSIVGMLLGSAMAAAVTNFLDQPALLAWGWRLPFLFGGIIGMYAISMRQQLPSSSHFVKHVKERQSSSPIKEVFTNNLKETVQGTLFASGYGVLFYISLVYLPTWLSRHSDLLLEKAMRINTLATALLVIMIPLAGWLSDKYIRRKKFITISMALFALFAVPCLLWLDTGNTAALAGTQLLFIILIAIPCGAAPAMFVELFPTGDRLSGYSIVFNLGMGIVGGSTPMIITWIISATGLAIIPAFYMVLWAVISIAALAWMKDRSRAPLR